MPYPEGTCRSCGGPPEEGRSRCADCAFAHRERAELARANLRKMGLCLVCMQRAAKGKRYCAAHLKYYAERARERRRKKRGEQ